MLFQQKKEAVLCGKGTGGAEISCLLADENGTGILKAKAQVNRSGEFRLSFTAPEGGYKSYTITLYVNGREFRTLKDVVFGELWLASGQSNMQYSFSESSTYEQNKERSEWLRFLYIDPYVTFNGSPDSFPLEALSDIEPGCCRWLKGTDNIDSVSAVSFFFAQELQKKLDMPVGVLMPNLGGSLLASWLSREAIDSDPAFAEYLKTQGLYISPENWNSIEIVWYSTMTANYNKKVSPLRNFAISGMIWYQGESEILCDWEIGYYTRGLELLQSSYSELFGFESSKMPFVATQVAPYAYGDKNFSLHNNEFTEFQKAEPSSRAMTTIYDIDLGYYETVGPIHPYSKQPVGERMAASAYGLVYCGSECCTAATVDSFRTDGNSFFVTLRNVGDGLAFDGKKAIGFSLAEEGGIYVQADAEIVSENTLRVYSDEVEKPVSCAYAFAQNSSSANVYSTLNGENFMPIAPFCTDIGVNKLFWEEPAWAGCDRDEAFLLSDGSPYAGQHKIWSAENAEIHTDSINPYDGDGCLNIISDTSKKKFSVSPVYTYKDDGKEKYYDCMLRNWSNYSAVSVMVRNNGKNDVMLEGLKLYVNKVTWFAPEVDGCGEICTVIPADGQWHKLTFDLDRLYLHGDECGAVYSRRKLSEIDSFSLCFSDGKKQSSDLSIDEFRFTGNVADGKRGFFEPCLLRADNPWEFFCGIFTSVFGLIRAVFIK